MALTVPAGERDVVCRLFIPLSVDYWKARCKKIRIYIFSVLKKQKKKKSSIISTTFVFKVQNIKLIMHVGIHQHEL